MDRFLHLDSVPQRQISASIWLANRTYVLKQGRLLDM